MIISSTSSYSVLYKSWIKLYLSNIYYVKLFILMLLILPGAIRLFYKKLDSKSDRGQKIRKKNPQQPHQDVPIIQKYNPFFLSTFFSCLLFVCLITYSMIDNS